MLIYNTYTLSPCTCLLSTSMNHPVPASRCTHEKLACISFLHHPLCEKGQRLVFTIRFEESAYSACICILIQVGGGRPPKCEVHRGSPNALIIAQAHQAMQSDISHKFCMYPYTDLGGWGVAHPSAKGVAQCTCNLYRCSC